MDVQMGCQKHLEWKIVSEIRLIYRNGKDRLDV